MSKKSGFFVIGNGVCKKWENRSFIIVLFALAMIYISSFPSPSPAQEKPQEKTLAAFGYDIFRESKEPIVEGPVDDQYILSPGDEVIITVWGQLNLRYPLTVNEEGFLDITEKDAQGEVSQSIRIFTNGVNLKELRSTVTKSFAGIYASYINADNPSQSTAFVDVKLGKVRKLLVYVVGEVKNQGAYTISSGVATLLNLLNNAGGVKETGSLREIKIRRADGKMDGLDLYDFLLTGKIEPKKTQIRSGDYIIVPLKQKSAAIRGEVRRPLNYEIIGTEGIKELIGFAGGFTPDAFLKRSQIRRYELNKGEVFLDIDLDSLYADPKKNYALVDRDVVTVLTNIQVRKNIVSIGGEGIVRPGGTYEWKPGMTLNDLVEKAEGLREHVYLDRADLIRTEDDFCKKLTIFSLKELYKEEKPGIYRFSGNKEKNFALKEMDEILIYSAFGMAGKDKYVTLEGHVKEPGRYILAKNMSLYDLVFSRSGFQDADFKKKAFLDLAHITRKVPGTIGEKIIPFNLGALLNMDPSANIPIENNDVVRIYSFEQLAMKYQVMIDGLVKNPGTFPMSENLTLEDLIVLAGGLRPDAYKVEAVVARTEAEGSRKEVPEREYPTFIIPIEPGFAGLPQEKKTPLKAFDRITIRSLLGWEPLEVVNIRGEVLYPGNYSLAGKAETISSLIKKAGGLKKEALPEGAMVSRNRSILTLAPGEAPQNYEITINLAEALKNPGGAYDIVLKGEDRIFIPTNPGTVEVRGAVKRPLILQHKEGQKLDDYVAICGGYLDTADKSNTVVYYANNAAQKTSWFLFFKSIPEIASGSVIEVPFQDEAVRLETVEIKGAVVKPAVIQHIKGQRLGYYLNLCGGFSKDADVDKVVVHLPDGGLLIKKENEAFNPLLPPGSIVVVTAKSSPLSK